MSGKIKSSRFLTLLSIITLLAGAISCSKSEKPITKDTFVMGTRAWITVYSKDRTEAEKAIKKAFREFYRIDSAMSNWKKTSEISRLNSLSGKGPARVSEELFNIIERAFSFSRLTDGAFDITARPLVTLWGFEGGKVHLPDHAEVKEALSRVGYTRVSLNRDSLSVTLPDGFEIDLAGIAKGYAVDRARDILENCGMESALINLGGNIYAMGNPPGKDGWKIGVRDPLGSTRVVARLVLRDLAVATSADYENYNVINGKRYGHIIDPATGYPASGVLSVTVIAKEAITADALSTGFFVLGPERSKEKIDTTKEVRALFAVQSDSGSIEYIKIGEFGPTCRLTLKK